MKKITLLLSALVFASACFFTSCGRSDKEKIIDLYSEYRKAEQNGDRELAAKIAAAAEEIAARLSQEDIDELAAMGPGN